MKNKILFFCICIFPLYADLSNYYTSAIKESYLLKEAQAQLEAKKIAIDKNRAKNGFKLTWNGSIGRENDNSENDNYDAIYNNKSYGINLNKALYNPSNNLNINTALIEYDKERLLLKKTVQDYSQQFLDKYFEIQQLSYTLQLSIKNLNFAKKSYERAKELKKFQLIDNTSFLEIETNLEEANKKYTLTDIRYKKAFAIFKLYTHLKIQKQPSFKKIKDLKNLQTKLTKQIESNIDLELLKQDKKLLQIKLNHYKKWYMPTLNFNTKYSNTQSGSKENYDREQLSGSISIQGSLYPDSEVSTSKKEIIAQLHSIENKYEATKKELEIQIMYEELELQNHLATIKILKSKYNKFKYELKITQQKHTMGLSDIIKSLDIQKNIFDIENNIIENSIKVLKTYSSIEMKRTVDFSKIINTINQYN